LPIELVTEVGGFIFREEMVGEEIPVNEIICHLEL
jgi:hypothetical protein